MKNIFEGVDFGDKFLTRNNKRAVFCGFYIDEYQTTWGKCLIEGETECRFYDNFGNVGLSGRHESDLDIVTRYKKQVDVDKLATEALEEINPTKALNKVEAFDWGFKAGYNKAN